MIVQLAADPGDVPRVKQMTYVDALTWLDMNRHEQHK